MNKYPLKSRITSYGWLECANGVGYRDITRLDLTKEIEQQDEKVLLEIIKILT